MIVRGSQKTDLPAPPLPATLGTPSSKRTRWLRLGKWVAALSGLLLLLLVLLIILRNPLLKGVTQLSIASETGLPTALDDFDLGFTDGSLHLKGLSIVNTPEFGGVPFIDIPEIYLKIAMDSTGDKVSFDEVRFHVSEITVVRNADGQMNIDSLKKTRRARKKKRRTKMDLEVGHIDKLVLTVGKVSFVDMANPDQNHEVNLNIDHEVMTGIKGELDLQARLVALAGRVALEQYFKQTKAPALNKKALKDFLREVTGH